MLTLAAFAPLALAADDVPTIEFSIRPNLCVLAEGERECSDRLQIRWRSPQRQALCLYQSDKRLPLRCWEGEYSGEYLVAISASSKVDFQLRDMRNKDLLVADSFDVVQDNAKYRHRRRNGWSFF